jgi:hypothetical protein
MNKVFLIGNLTKDPELLDLEAGVKLTKFVIATNKNWLNKEGEKNGTDGFSHSCYLEETGRDLRHIFKERISRDGGRKTNPE